MLGLRLQERGRGREGEGGEREGGERGPTCGGRDGGRRRKAVAGVPPPRALREFGNRGRRRKGLVDLGIATGEAKQVKPGRGPAVSDTEVTPGDLAQTAGGNLCVTYRWARIAVAPAIQPKPPAVNCDIIVFFLLRLINDN